MTETNSLKELLHLFVATVERLEQRQLDQLLAGDAKLAFVVTKKSKEEIGPSPVNSADILAKLNECKDRDKAREILEEIRSRDALAAFGRTLKVHVVKHDRREDIESKIIEFVIGGKLRSEAIQSLNLKGGSGRPLEDDQNK